MYTFERPSTYPFPIAVALAWSQSWLAVAYWTENLSLPFSFPFGRAGLRGIIPRACQYIVFVFLKWDVGTRQRHHRAR